MRNSPRALVSHFYLTIDNTPAPAVLIRDLEQVTVETSLHLPDVATVVLHDPQLTWIDEALLAPGRSLKIAARIEVDEQPLFDGEIVELEPEFDPSTQRLTVRAFDRLHRLARGRHARTFQNVNDDEVVRRLAREAGLEAKVGPTPHVHRHLFQANETNLDFLRGRAAALGFLLYVQGNTLHFEPPRAGVTPIPLAWSEALREFRPRLSTIGQVSSVVVRGWDPSQRRAIMGEQREGNGAPQISARGQSGGELARAAFGVEAQHLITDRPVAEQPVAEQLAQAAADRIAGRFIEAEGVCGGEPALVAGVPVQISGVGERFSGTYLVTSAVHSAGGDGAYDTRFSISGLHRSTLLSLLAPAPAQASHAAGLVVGVVTDNDLPRRLDARPR